MVQASGLEEGEALQRQDVENTGKGDVEEDRG